jgi:hypothetical protein
MRPLFACIALLPAGLCSFACGAGKAGHPSTASRRLALGSPSGHTAQVRADARAGYMRDDGDADYDDRPRHTPAESDDRGFLEASGGRAGPADTRAVRKLVERYYTAAAAGDAVIACSLLDKGLADELASERSSPRPGGRCSAAMSKMLAGEHEQLFREDPATMAVIGVRIKGDLGLAVLGFKAVPEGEVLIERTGGAWKMGALLDSRMP